MVGYDVAVVGELFIADCALAVLGDESSCPAAFAFPHSSGSPGTREGVGDRRCGGLPAAVAEFLSGSLLCRSRIESGELDTIDFDGVSWFPPVWIWGINADLR